MNDIKFKTDILLAAPPIHESDVTTVDHLIDLLEAAESYVDIYGTSSYRNLKVLNPKVVNLWDGKEGPPPTEVKRIPKDKVEDASDNTLKHFVTTIVENSSADHCFFIITSVDGMDNLLLVVCMEYVEIIQSGPNKTTLYCGRTCP